MTCLLSHTTHHDKLMKTHRRIHTMLKFWQCVKNCKKVTDGSTWDLERTISCQAEYRSELHHLSTSDSQMPETSDEVRNLCLVKTTYVQHCCTTAGMCFFIWVLFLQPHRLGSSSFLFGQGRSSSWLLHRPHQSCLKTKVMLTLGPPPQFSRKRLNFVILTLKFTFNAEQCTLHLGYFALETYFFVLLRLVDDVLVNAL